MKTLNLSTLLVASAFAALPTLAQAQSAAKPAAKPATTAKTTATAAKPATTAAKPATTSKPAATATAAKPAPAAPVAEATPEPAPAAAKPAATTAKASKSTASAGETFVKGSTAVNLGIGVGLGYGYGYGSIKSLPAMSLSVERGFIDGIGPGTIGIGGLIGYKGYHYDYAGGYKSSWNNILVSARGTYHYNILENAKLDTYGGISVGVRLQTWKDTYYDSRPELKGYNSSTAYITSGIFVGARYFFTDNIGAFGELGYDMNYLKVGLSAKF
jgi:hypothetical protein